MARTYQGHDYFALFDLPATYQIDAGELSRRYRALQQRFHPDRFATADEAERRKAVQRSAELNDAFQTLKDPLKRARYLLAQAGVETDDETDTVMDAGFLMQQLEWRERLELVRGDAVSGRDVDLARLSAEVAQQFADKCSQLPDLLVRDSAQARTLVREMQFLRRLTEEVASLDGES